ncbi:hypothetical protein H4219_000028 [Mycoemilia scoparia]|uniref:Cytokinin riboside 5'-monophosphate phosphoribohydrolase n=1 Tax=Mycoemilia scoparia TaxID=417184 RepID=A0A9W8DXN3_9FUNG|nr:hypothetical protein H4219_000028 [Mycoemilia scoparia]
MAEQGFSLVYGGGGRGLMGARGGKVLGIMPEALINFEGSIHFGETIKVPDMHTRKRLMNEHSDAFICLPGGYGTMEELLEMTTWSQLSIHNKPIIAINLNGFFTPLKEFVMNAVKAGFINEGCKDIIYYAETPDEALAYLEKYKNPETKYRLNWQTSTEHIG